VKKTVCAFALVLTGIGVTVPPAYADSERCVSRGEFSRVHDGMSKRRVHRIFDVRGRRTVFVKVGRFSTEIRRYRGCPRRSRISVVYGNGRVESKAARW
jgi:hypothetical protein